MKIETLYDVGDRVKYNHCVANGIYEKEEGEILRIDICIKNNVYIEYIISQYNGHWSISESDILGKVE